MLIYLKLAIAQCFEVNILDKYIFLLCFILYNILFFILRCHKKKIIYKLFKTNRKWNFFFSKIYFKTWKYACAITLYNYCQTLFNENTRFVIIYIRQLRAMNLFCHRLFFMTLFLPGTQQETILYSNASKRKFVKMFQPDILVFCEP